MARARLNLETELWTDARFQNLMIELGDRFKATGVVVHLWLLAQKYWCPDRKPIPEGAWAASELPEAVIACGLAERREDGIYAKGAEQRFQWWFDGIEQRRNAGQQRANGGQRDPSGRWIAGPLEPAGASGIQPSSSSSSSRKRRVVVAPTGTTLLWDFYSKRLEQKRQTQAVHQGAKTNKLCKTLVDRHGIETAQRLVESFVGDEDGFVRDQAWSLGILVSQDQKYLARLRKPAKATLTFGEEGDCDAADVRSL